eukprot:Gb_10515 [translate_table: standard]
MLRFPITFLRAFSRVIDGLKYVESLEWIEHEDRAATGRITHHAQDHLGEVVLIDLEKVGAPVAKWSSLGEDVLVDLPEVEAPFFSRKPQMIQTSTMPLQGKPWLFRMMEAVAIRKGDGERAGIGDST